MTTQSPTEHADAELRALVAGTDPESGLPTEVPSHLLGRVLSGAESEYGGEGGFAAALGSSPASGSASTDRPSTGTQHRSFVSRHWQGLLMTAASVLTLALAAGTVLPGLASSSDDSAAGSMAEPAAAPTSAAAAGAAADDSLGGKMSLTDGSTSAALRDQAGASDSGAAAATADEQKNTMVRSASMLVGADDVKAARDAFVAMVLSKGGQVLSENVVTDANASATLDYNDTVAADTGVSYPYPGYPSGPGIWLTVQVPAADYDATVAAAQDLGQVVQLQQSAYDVGSQITDTDARIAALEASLTRLEGLMDDAKTVNEVVKVENAITERQAELDSLKAQQRDLTNQTAMSSVSLTLMTPEDATQSVNPQPEPKNWWESFLDGLTDLWSWLGRALLIVSPLLIAGAIIWWVRRRHGGAAATPAATATAPEPTTPTITAS